MGMSRVTEKEFQKTFLAMAKARGWRSAHFRSAMTKGGNWVTPVAGQGKGFPDNLLIRGKMLIVAELKVPPNTTSPEQDAWLAAFAAAGIPAFVWTPDDWTEIERVLENGI